MTRLTRKNAELNENVLTISAEHGLVGQEEFFNRRIASKNLSNYFLLEQGEFVYSKSSTKDYPVGAIKRLDAHEKGVVSPLYICFALTDLTVITSDYIAHLFESGALDGQIRLIAREGGRAHGLLNVKPSEFFEVVADLPSLPEQRKVAAILSSVDDAIEKTQAVIDQVQVVKRGLMQELLTRGLPGRHTRFRQTEIGEIPEDWRLFRIEQVGIVEAGRQRSPKAQGKPRPYLRVANVYDGYIDTTSLLSMPFSEPEFVRLKLVPGDLLLNEGQSKELVGRCAQYSGEPRDCCFQNTLVRFQAGEHIRARFAFWAFRHYFYSGVFSAIARQTTSVAHLGVSRFANLKLALPDLEEQAAIVEGLETLNAREEIERCRLSQLGIVKSALMSVLLTGELRVILDGAVA